MDLLTPKIQLSGPEGHDPEDYLRDGLGGLYPDDITNQHGDESHSVIYKPTPPSGEEPDRVVLDPITLSVCDPSSDSSRKLFSHFVWNASVQLATFIEDSALPGHSEYDVSGESVLEVGAGTGLSGIMSALMGASTVAITDYPTPEVLANLRSNVKTNIPSDGSVSVSVSSHKWGELTDSFSVENGGKFTRILVADCLWMPEQHVNLLRSIRHFLRAGGKAWVIAGFHTGRVKMAGFFDEKTVKEQGLVVEKIYERDASGRERPWVSVPRDGEEQSGQSEKRWLVIATLTRLQ